MCDASRSQTFLSQHASRRKENLQLFDLDYSSPWVTNVRGMAPVCWPVVLMCVYVCVTDSCRGSWWRSWRGRPLSQASISVKNKQIILRRMIRFWLSFCPLVRPGARSLTIVGKKKKQVCGLLLCPHHSAFFYIYMYEGERQCLSESLVFTVREFH